MFFAIKVSMILKIFNVKHVLDKSKWVVINRALTHTHTHPVTFTHAHPHPAKKRSHSPTPSQKRSHSPTPTHTQSKKGYTHNTHAHPAKKRS